MTLATISISRIWHKLKASLANENWSQFCSPNSLRLSLPFGSWFRQITGGGTTLQPALPSEKKTINTKKKHMSNKRVSTINGRVACTTAMKTGSTLTVQFNSPTIRRGMSPVLTGESSVGHASYLELNSKIYGLFRLKCRVRAEMAQKLRKPGSSLVEYFEESCWKMLPQVSSAISNTSRGYHDLK